VNPPRLSLILKPGRLAVCRLEPDQPLPEWSLHSPEFITMSRTRQELSITALESVVPDYVRAERGYRALMVEGPVPQNLIGIFASIVTPLAAAGMPIFAISTFDTDYVLVKEELLQGAVQVLEAAGHMVVSEQ
jgi:hypothetical protein